MPPHFPPRCPQSLESLYRLSCSQGNGVSQPASTPALCSLSACDQHGASVAPWLCPGTLAQWKVEPSIAVTHHVGFAAAERDNGAVHGPYGFNLGHITSNNLRGEKEICEGRDRQNRQFILLTGCCLVRTGVSSHTVRECDGAAREAGVGGMVLTMLG